MDRRPPGHYVLLAAPDPCRKGSAGRSRMASPEGAALAPAHRRRALLDRLARPDTLLLGADALSPFLGLQERGVRLLKAPGIKMRPAEIVVQGDEPAPGAVVGCRHREIDRPRHPLARP